MQVPEDHWPSSLAKHENDRKIDWMDDPLKLDNFFSVFDIAQTTAYGKHY